MNPAEPELPASVEPIVHRMAAEDPDATHPAAVALARYDEEPDALSPRTRRWIEAHLVACRACREALDAVPRLEPRSRPLYLRAWPLVAAAGWILAALLGFAALERAREPFLSVHSMVLSNSRGGADARVPPTARVLRCELVLGEEVPLGAVLHVRVADPAGRTLVEEDRRVEERNEREWPVLTLDREALPRGTVRLHVRTPQEIESVFELDL